MKKILSLIFIALPNLLFAQMPNKLSDVDKIYGLSKFWQEVNYNFVYFSKIDKAKWINEYKRLISEVQETKNDFEYYRLLQKYCATLKDGHTNVYFPKEIERQMTFTDFGDYKFLLGNIDGKAIITKINLSKKDELPIGTEILTVNGYSTKNYIAEFVKPYLSASTDYVRDNESIKYLLYAPYGTSFNIDFCLPNGETKTLCLINRESKSEDLFPEMDNGSLLDFEWKQKSIAYMSLNAFDNPKIVDLFKEKLPDLHSAKSLIIDLRNNDGGSSVIGKEILEYLTNDTILYGSKSMTRMYVPTFKAWGDYLSPQDTINGKPGWGMSKEETTKYYHFAHDEGFYNFEYVPDTISRKIEKIVVPTVILIGNVTASAAEDFLIYADNQKHMIKIGEPTNGSTGQPIFFTLPGGGTARICTKKDIYPDGIEFVGYGIQPNILVKKTLSDFIENKDPALERAIQYFQDK